CRRLLEERLVKTRGLLHVDPRIVLGVQHQPRQRGAAPPLLLLPQQILNSAARGAVHRGLGQVVLRALPPLGLRAERLDDAVAPVGGVAREQRALIDTLHANETAQARGEQREGTGEQRGGYQGGGGLRQRDETCDVR